MYGDHSLPPSNHNGGPPLDEPKKHYLGQKYIRLFEDYTFAGVWGGRGTGKSRAAGTYLMSASAQSNKRIVCARQFQNSINDSVKELLVNAIYELGIENQYKIYDREIVHKEMESRFTFIGLDRNPASAKSLEGADICWVEEANTINNISLETLLPTIRKPGSRLIFTWNPDKRSDPVDKFFRGGPQPPNSILIPTGIEDNPYFYHTTLPSLMYHMRAGNYERYRHVWLGDYDESYESKVFQNVAIGTMPVTPYDFVCYGMDFGFGADPSVVIKCIINTERKQIYIEREAYGRVPLDQLPAMMDSILDSRAEKITADSSQPGTIEHLATQGFNITGAKKGPGSVKTGINWLQGYQIIINPGCEATREEASLYSWQIDRITKMRLSIPVDVHNHCWDAVRYATEEAQLTDGRLDDTDGIIKLRFGKRSR